MSENTLELLSVADEGGVYCAICGLARSGMQGCKTTRRDPMISCEEIEHRVVRLIARIRELEEENRRLQEIIRLDLEEEHDSDCVCDACCDKRLEGEP